MLCYAAGWHCLQAQATGSALSPTEVAQISLLHFHDKTWEWHFIAQVDGDSGYRGYQTTCSLISVWERKGKEVKEEEEIHVKYMEK